VPGLSIGGEGLGYVVLSRKGGKDENGVSPSEQVTRWYYETIVQDGFISETREGDEEAMWTTGQDVDQNFQAVTKLDGEVSMINVLKDEDVEAKDRKIGNTVFKIAAAATGRYQPLDVGPIFKFLHDGIDNLYCDILVPTGTGIIGES
jgi:hypothetical protein